jgi:hypothetical protein
LEREITKRGGFYLAGKGWRNREQQQHGSMNNLGGLVIEGGRDGPIWERGGIGIWKIEEMDTTHLAIDGGLDGGAC